MAGLNEVSFTFVENGNILYILYIEYLLYYLYDKNKNLYRGNIISSSKYTYA